MGEVLHPSDHHGGHPKAAQDTWKMKPPPGSVRWHQKHNTETSCDTGWGGQGRAKEQWDSLVTNPATNLTSQSQCNPSSFQTTAQHRWANPQASPELLPAHLALWETEVHTWKVFFRSQYERK